MILKMIIQNKLESKENKKLTEEFSNQLCVLSEKIVLKTSVKDGPQAVFEQQHNLAKNVFLLIIIMKFTSKNMISQLDPQRRKLMNLRERKTMKILLSLGFIMEFQMLLTISFVKTKTKLRLLHISSNDLKKMLWTKMNCSGKQSRLFIQKQNVY